MFLLVIIVYYSQGLATVLVRCQHQGQVLLNITVQYLFNIFSLSFVFYDINTVVSNIITWLLALSG